MIHHIYGVVIDSNGEKERRYFGHVDTLDEAKEALNGIIDGLDYAYAKEGTVTVLYLDRGEARYLATRPSQDPPPPLEDRVHPFWRDQTQPLPRAEERSDGVIQRLLKRLHQKTP